MNHPLFDKRSASSIEARGRGAVRIGMPSTRARRWLAPLLMLALLGKSASRRVLVELERGD